VDGIVLPKVESAADLRTIDWLITNLERERSLPPGGIDLMPIIFVSRNRTEPGDRVAGLLVGGDDYLVKPLDPNELLARVRRLLPAALAGERTARGLTRRELDVLSLLVDGLSQPEIAAKLFVTPKTVGKHIEHILAKLGVHSRAQAVAVAVRDELIETHRRAPDVEAHRSFTT